MGASSVECDPSGTRTRFITVVHAGCQNPLAHPHGPRRTESPDCPSIIRQRVDPPVHAPAEEEVRDERLERVPVRGQEQAAGDRAERVELPLGPPEAGLQLLRGSCSWARRRTRSCGSGPSRCGRSAPAASSSSRIFRPTRGERMNMKESGALYSISLVDGGVERVLGVAVEAEHHVQRELDAVACGSRRTARCSGRRGSASC